MAKRKINVLSNELDQAPKTRAAGYGKVVNSMRKEINEAMDKIFLNGSDVIAHYMNTNEIPIKQLLGLQPGDRLSFEIRREKPERSGWMETVGHPAFLGDFNNFTNNCLLFQNAGPIKPGEISTIIVVEKDANDPKSWKIHAEQLEYPGKGTLLMEGMFFHNPKVSDEKFQEIIGTSKDKEEIKELLKENINEEIKLEEKENKTEEKREEDKKGFGKTIKGWFGKK